MLTSEPESTSVNLNLSSVNSGIISIIILITLLIEKEANTPSLQT